MGDPKKKRWLILLVSIAGALVIAAITTGIFLLLPHKGKEEKTLERAGEILKDIGRTQSGNVSSGDESRRVSLPSKVIQKGEAGKVGDLILKVKGWEFSGGEDFQEPAPGNVFLVVFVDVKNVGENFAKVSSAVQMSAVTDGSYEHDIAMYFPEPRFEGGEIAPGRSISGKVAFEVPDDAQSIHFVFDYSPGEAIAVKLK